MNRALATALVAFGLAFAVRAAWGRSTVTDLDVSQAVSSAIGRERLLDVSFYLIGQSHPAIRDDLGEFRSNRRTNAFNKSDEEACQIAFLSALLALQERARSLGGDAVVDVKSITKWKVLESPTHFRCVAGNVVANVALSGRVVKLRR